MASEMDWEAEVRETLKKGKILWVSRNEIREVVVLHPSLDVDKDGIGHLIFSPSQARELAKLLLKHADECEQ